jgi:hypothetical protein
VHPHNGYYAGDFTTTTKVSTAEELVVAGGAAASRHPTVVPASPAEARTSDAGPGPLRAAA